MHVTARFSKVVGKQRLCVPASIVKVEGKRKNDTHQHLCPQGDSQSTPATLEDPLRLENESPSPAFQAAAFMLGLGPGMCESVCKPF